MVRVARMSVGVAIDDGFGEDNVKGALSRVG